MTLTFRPPVASDADALGALHVRCWRQAYAGIVNAAYLSSLSEAARAGMWRKTIAEGGSFALLACDGGEPVGFVISGKARPAVAALADGEVYAIYVEFHRRGIGYRLFEAARHDWQDRSGERLAAQVIAENERAVAFYRRQGGREALIGTLELGGQMLNEITFVHQVKSSAP